MIRLTVRSDFPMDVAISFWSIRLFLEMQSNTARSSKVTFKVPFWPFGEENNILIPSIRQYNKNTRAVVRLTETSQKQGRLGQIRPKNVGDVPIIGTSPTLWPVVILQVARTQRQIDRFAAKKEVSREETSFLVPEVGIEPTRL